MKRAHCGTGTAMLWLRMLMLAGLVLLTWGVSRVHANAGFGNDSLHGAYAVQSSGKVDSNDLTSIGRISFDGHGGCTYVTTMTIAPSSVIGPISTTSCTYVVHRDGTGTLSMTLPSLGSFTFAFVIAAQGQEVLGIPSSPPGAIGTLVMKEQ
jgi:hypothetical protein